MTAPTRPAPGEEDAGRIMLLVLVYSLVLFLLVTAIATATSVHLQRTRLASLADAAALDAADALSPTRYYATDRPAPVVGRGQVPLDDARVRDSAAAYLRTAPDAARLDGVVVGAPTRAVAAGTAEVTLVARARVPIVTVVTAGLVDRIDLRVTSRAQARRPVEDPQALP
ncbi:MAG: hypothetical protein U0Q15_17745 [Kineosporiaceae bacterium]